MFELVPTLGVRESLCTKWVLEGRWTRVAVGGFDVRIKLGLRGADRDGDSGVADVAAAVEQAGRAEREILAEAIVAGTAAGLIPGGSEPA